MTERPHVQTDDSSRPGAERGASTGQILVMFALLLTALLGALGLSVDLGVAFSQRRTMQSAADAGALAGTRMVAKNNVDSVPTSVLSEVTNVIQKNKLSGGNISSIDCNYVTDNGSVITPCVSVIPPTASGVEVKVTESHPTYFIRVVPGAPNTVSTNALARANVKIAPVIPGDGPYLPCGIHTQLVSGGSMDMMIKTGGSGTNATWIVNPLAVNQTFIIHGPQIEKCEAKASRYKGLADNTVNLNLVPPAWFSYKEGDTAGFISTDVQGPDGCKAGQEVVNCVAFLPIVVPEPVEVDNNRKLWCVGFAPFYITAPKSNEHNGKLLRDYIVYGKGQDGTWGWNQNYSGPIVIRLTK